MADGTSVSTTSRYATCWCAEGAIEVEGGACTGALIALEHELGRIPHRWNDDRGRTADEVADAMERAAAKLEAGQ